MCLYVFYPELCAQLLICSICSGRRKVCAVLSYRINLSIELNFFLAFTWFFSSLVFLPAPPFSAGRTQSQSIDAVVFSPFQISFCWTRRVGQFFSRSFNSNQLFSTLLRDPIHLSLFLTQPLTSFILGTLHGTTAKAFTQTHISIIYTITTFQHVRRKVRICVSHEEGKLKKKQKTKRRLFGLQGKDLNLQQILEGKQGSASETGPQSTAVYWEDRSSCKCKLLRL